MENNKKDRTVLKSYFKTNAVPTELNFRDFIEAGLNQKEDGIAKIPDGPIAVQSASTNEDLLHFYRSFEDTEATWSLGLKGEAKSGLSINEGAAANRLFIEPGTGNIGVGTTTPAGKLDVNANDAKGVLIRSGNATGGYDKSQLTFGYNGSAQYRHAIKTRHHGGEQPSNAMDFYIWNHATNNKADDMPTKKVLTLNGNGNVGVNLPSDQHVAAAKLQVIAGDGTSPETNGLYVLNNRNEENQHAIIAARVQGPAGGNPFISMDVKETGGWSIGVDNKAGQALKFGSDWDTLTKNTRMTMLRTGNIGVGIDQPAAKFQINANDDSTPEKNGLMVSNAKNSANQNAIIAARVAGGESGNPMISLDVVNKVSWLMGIDNKTNALKLSSHWSDLNANTRMTLLNDGRIGVGISPVAKLHIDATADGTPEKNGLMVSNASANNHAIVAARVAGAGNGNPMLSLDIVGRASWLIGIDNKSSALKFSNAYSDLNNTTRMTMLNNGNIGIATDSPAAKLDVNVVDANGMLIRSGNGAGATERMQLAFSWAGNTTYRHGIKTRHDSGSKTGNAMDFFIWNQGTDKDVDVPTANVMSINGNGNVGIGLGVGAPSARLHINPTGAANPDSNGVYVYTETKGTDAIVAVRTGGEAANPFISFDLAGINGWSVGMDRKDKSLKFAYAWNNINANTRMALTSGGWLGIMNTDPKAPLHVSGSGNTGNLNGNGAIMTIDKYENVWDKNVSAELSIRADYAIGTRTVFVCHDNMATASDIRTKEIVARSNIHEDLETLCKIQVTDYTYKDKFFKGGKVHKKVIAQEVEAIYPQAVNKRTDIIPDIYAPAAETRFNAAAKELTIRLNKNHGLKAGDTVELVFDQSRQTFAVLKATAYTFVVSMEEDPGNVFVFGKEVNDFRFLDYDALFMLSISSIQAMNKEMNTLREELQGVKNKLSAYSA